MTNQESLIKLMEIAELVHKSTKGLAGDFMRIIPLLVRGQDPFSIEELKISQIDIEEWKKLLKQVRTI
jgi:hypothetical protein